MEPLTTELLSTLQLSEHEARVYVAALELGQASLLALSKKSGVKRTTIYHFLDTLIQRQLIVETKRGKRSVFSAVHPQQLVEIGKGHVREMERLMPQLLAVFNASPRKPRVTFHEGTAGMKEVYADTLKERQPIVGWSDYEYSMRVMGSYFEQYAEERARRNILYRVIARDSDAARNRQALSRRHLRDVRISPTLNLTTEIHVYGKKIALLSFRSNPIFAVIIEDESMAQTFKTIWEAAWENLRP